MEDQAEYKTNPKGGRPKKEAAKGLTSQIGVRFSKADRIKIMLKADKVRLSASEYIRQSAINGKIKQPPTPEEIQLYRDLSGIANNLNQLTKEAHQQNLPMIAPKLLKTLQSVNQLINQINDYKNEHR